MNVLLYLILLISFQSGYAKNGAMVVLSFVKLVLVFMLSMSQDNWWTYGSDSSVSRNNEIVESCSNPDASQCHSFCMGNINIINTTITDDYYVQQDDDVNGYHGTTTTATYCIASLPGSCAYKYWLIFKLVPLLAHTIVLLLQCWCLYKYKEFTPQEVQYGLIRQYLYPSVAPGDPNSPVINTFRTLLGQLLERPIFSVFSFIEFITAVYVWGELLYPSTTCNNINPLSTYYYPILMTLFDMGKLNLYNANIHLQKGELMKAAAASLDLYSFSFYLMLTTLLGLHFIYGVLQMLWKCINDLTLLPSKFDGVNRTGTNSVSAELVGVAVKPVTDSVIGAFQESNENVV